MGAEAAMVERYLEGAGKLRQVCAGLDSTHLRSRPIPGKWSILEVVCHISDFEPIYADRMKRIISHDRPLLIAADEQLFASRLSYHDRDLEEELNLVELVRRQMARILLALSDEDWRRLGIHNEQGQVRLDELLSHAVRHVEHHVPFIEEKRRALGVSS